MPLPSRPPGAGIIIGLAILMVIIWVSLPLVAVSLIGKPKSAGEVGDAFNLANSLFSGFALIGVVYTIYLQRWETHNRFRQAEEQRAREKKELEQTLYTVRLQLTRSSIDEHRQVIPDLIPFIAKLPTSEDKLTHLRDRVSREINQTKDNSHLIEAKQRIDEVILLQRQVHKIRIEMEAANGQDSPPA